MLHLQVINTGSYDPEKEHFIQSFIPREREHYSLPGDVTKAQAIAVGVEGLRLLGATERELSTYRHIADTTDRTAWHDSSRAPVNWRRQCDMARELGMSESHFRRIEKRLERFGVLARTTASNGYRGRRSGQRFGATPSAGLSLEPMLANYSAFVHVIERAAQAEEARQGVLWNIRSAERRGRLLIRDIPDTETRRWAEVKRAVLWEEHRPTILRSASIEELTEWHMALFDLEDLVREAITPLSVEDASRPASGSNAAQDPGSELACAAPCPVQAVDTPDPDLSASPLEATTQATDNEILDNEEKQQDMSAAPLIGERCHIQPKKNLNESCNARRPSIATPAYADDFVNRLSTPFGDDNCFEKKYAGDGAILNPSILQKLTPDALQDLASEDAALYLDALEDWNEAIPMILRELGINFSAWHAACELMGEEIAFIALLIIDRNRFHPITPVRSPGGALRAFTDRARRGELNLTHAILGIWERERQGKQPKATAKVVQ